MAKLAGRKYLLITPVRDEEKYLECTIRSVVAQTLLPEQWIIVDDGSTDRTPEIIHRHAAQHPWIKPHFRKNRGFRQPGSGVVEAFYDGYGAAQCHDWDFIVKLDGDLGLPPDFFDQALAACAAQPRLGICGGVLYHEIDGKLVEEKCPRFHVRGATKIYRRECWQEIGGLQPWPGWDTIDELKGNMLGWITQTLPQLRVIHYRFTGTAESKWQDMVKNGRADYFSGYHPLFMMLKCFSRAFKWPYGTGALGLAHGFLSGYLQGLPRVPDPELIRYLRREQLRRLMGAPTIWK
jgi:glycosyltransferase involved in cell wall biosynthesis